MTTSARDENWSEWIDWSGGTCPVFADTFVQWKGREANQNGSASIQAGNLYWEHKDDAMDIIAYRYKIKEPESAMHPDLEWLARNARPKQFGQISVRRNADFHAGYQWSDLRQTGEGWYHHSKVEAARQQLGLDQPEVTPVNKCLDNAWDEPTPEEEEAWQAKERSNAAPYPEADNVNKPKHYHLREGYEVYDLRQDLAAKAANGGATYDQYSDWDRAIEYIVRMWGKNRLEDAKKGRWYLDKLIGKLEAQE